MERISETAASAVGVSFDRIIVPVSFYPPNNRAIRVAEYLAAQFGCAIELTSMLYDRGNEPERRRLLDELATAIEHRTVQVTLDHGTDPSPFILDLINTPDSLVVLAGGTTVLGIPGSITSDVLRFASRPAVIVGPKVTTDWHGPVKNLVIPLDASQAAETVLETASGWAGATGATLDLVQVISPKEAAAVRSLGNDVEEAAYLEQVSNSLEHTSPARITWDVLHGTALHKATVICDRAREHPASMICMATHGSRHTHSMIASTTMRVIHHSTVPVMVVRS